MIMNLVQLREMRFVLLVTLVRGIGWGSGREMKRWTPNTNFGNPLNWEGLVDGNCSGNIFSFPGWMGPSVVAFPSNFIGKQIILPVNGHLVFQPGLTTLSDAGSCQHGREVKFRRTSRADWFNPQNWATIDGDADETSKTGHVPRINEAMPHVERVPCQYDAVKFPERSTFSLTISQNVTIGKFFLGKVEQPYLKVALLMTDPMGMLQFHKAPEVDFALTNQSCYDDELCVCNNYKAAVKQKICSLAVCPLLRSGVSGSGSREEDCDNPILPHGFCCPVCGFHIKVKHNGNLQLAYIWDQLVILTAPHVGSDPGKSSDRYQSGLDYYVSRHRLKGAHVVIIPRKNFTAQGIQLSRKIVELLGKWKDVGVEEVTWSGSWEEVPSDVDKWQSGSLNGGLITLIVFIILAILLAILLFLFYRKKNQGTSISSSPNFRNILSSFTMPNLSMPNIPLPVIPGRRGNTSAGGHTFGFARFSNDRVSTVNIGTAASSPTPGKNSSLGNSPDGNSPQVAVDEEIYQGTGSLDSGLAMENVTVTSSGVGFSTLSSYDIIGGAGMDTFNLQGSTTTAATTNMGSSDAEDANILESFSQPLPQPHELRSQPQWSSGNPNFGATSAPPAKPSRSNTNSILSADETENLYDELVEVTTDDTAAILQPKRAVDKEE